MDKLTLIKVGGKIVEEQETLSRLLAAFAAIPGRKVLVHGGGHRYGLPLGDREPNGRRSSHYG
jgi:acetylglutamate kinase